MESTKPPKDTSWLTPYLRALEITRVPEAQRSWSIRSVEQFALFLMEKPLHASTREDVESFTASLRSASGAEEWKVQRAIEALRLLLTAVYDKSWEHASGASAGNTANASLDPLRTACRARGYSRRTEESYAQWVRRFEMLRRTLPASFTDARAVRSFLENGFCMKCKPSSKIPW